LSLRWKINNYHQDRKLYVHLIVATCHIPTQYNWNIVESGATDKHHNPPDLSYHEDVSNVLITKENKLLGLKLLIFLYISITFFVTFCL